MKRLTFLLVLLIVNIMSLKAQSYDKLQTETKFSALLNLIDQYYMDSTNLPKLTETAIRGMLKSMDPHSVYIPKDEIEKMNEQLVGSFDGIGISYQIFRDTLLVISPMPDGPSEKAGILAGDKIVRINGEDACGKKLDESFVYARLRGKKGTEVSLGIKRLGIDSLMSFKIVRDKIPINTISASYMVDDKTGYIRLTRFSGPSDKEFRDALVDLEDKGMESLIFDLRGNSGGYMNIAIDIADQFLPADREIVHTQGLRSQRQDFVSNGKGKFQKGKLIVLIDEGSASSSEIVAGALQDWDRALLIGRRSYGKGLVQKPYSLPDGSQVRLTTARYYTPSGRCIQRPYDEGTEKYFTELNRRVKHGELVNADSIRFPDSLKFHTTAGRTVYGGGGIMPDIFMAVDSSYATVFYNELIRKGILNDFCLEYVDKHRSNLKNTLKDKDIFFSEFSVSDEMINNFISYARKDISTVPDDQITKSLPEIRVQIKALIGRNLFGVQMYNKVMGEIDPMIRRAREVIRSGEEFSRLSLK